MMRAFHFYDVRKVTLSCHLVYLSTFIIMSSAKQLVHQVAISDESYTHIKSRLDSGKKAYVADKFGNPDEVAYDGSKNIVELSTGRKVIALGTIKASLSPDCMSNYARLVLRFGDPSMHNGPVSYFEKEGHGAVYNAENGTVRYVVKGQCWTCPEPSKYRCGKCAMARYCSKSCQGADWETHKLSCPHLDH